MGRPLIDADRLWARLMRLAEIGATPGGGVNRQALSDGEIEAWRLVIGWAQEAGLSAATDAAGNLFLILAGRDRAAPPVLLGSHLDSQPTGGKFDGAAGVLAAFEAVVSLAERGETPARDLIVVAWMNEEGSRFAPGMMGSEAFAGERSTRCDPRRARCRRHQRRRSARPAACGLSGAAAQAARFSRRRLSRIAYRAGSDSGSDRNM